MAENQSMPIEFDHLFIFTTTGAPNVDQLLNTGLLEGQRNVHPGQGTANRRIFFHNAMLEFIWVHNRAEVLSPVIKPLRLWERFRYQETGFSPFGIALRSTGQSPESSNKLPFDTWAFNPPYLPDHLQIDVARNEANIGEPLIFYIPFGARPDTHSRENRQPLAHPLGFREITGLKLTITTSLPKSAAVRTLEQRNAIAIFHGERPLAEATFDHGQADRHADFRPGLPLIFHW